MSLVPQIVDEKIESNEEVVHVLTLDVGELGHLVEKVQFLGKIHISEFVAEKSPKEIGTIVRELFGDSIVR